jgi:hypothetical protein
MSNHLPKNQQSESVITSSMMTPPPSAGTSVINIDIVVIGKN